jgi:hypothetical protein
LLLLPEFALDLKDLVVQRDFRDVFAVEGHHPADMLHGCQFEPLAPVTSVVDLNIQSGFLQIPIDDLCP